MSKLNAREFMYPDQLTKFVNFGNGAIVPFTISMNTSGFWVLISNDDEDALAKDAAAAEGHALFVDRGRGRGFEMVTDDERANEAQGVLDQAAALKAQQEEHQRLIKRAARKTELESQLAATLDKEGLGA